LQRSHSQATKGLGTFTLLEVLRFAANVAAHNVASLRLILFGLLKLTT